MPSLTKVQSGFMEAQGALPLSPGTAAAPGLKFDDHAGTGMFSPSTGAIAFSTSNHSQAVTFKDDGKVGISQASPSEKLEVYAGDILLSSNANGYSGGVGPNAALKFEYNGHQYAKIVGNGRDSSGYGDIDFYTSNSAGVSNLTQRMTIRADGKVGIGVTNPSHELDVVGNVRFKSNVTSSSLYLEAAVDTSYSQIVLQSVNSNDGSIQYWHSDNSMRFKTINDERLRIDSSGNLLLKTGEIDIQGGNKTIKTSAGFLQVGTSGSHYLSLITAGLQRLNITSSGTIEVPGGVINLGTAGTSSAHFNSTELMTFNIDTDNNSSSRYFAWYKNSNSGSGTELMRLNEDARLCIGGDFAPSANNLTLKHASGVEIDMNCTTGAGNNFRIKSDSGGIFTIRDHSAGVDRLTIRDNGKVGIGTNNPTETLVVNGTTRLGGGVDYGTDTILSVAPGSIQWDKPGVAGGKLHATSTDNWYLNGKSYPIYTSKGVDMNEVYACSTATSVNQGNWVYLGANQDGAPYHRKAYKISVPDTAQGTFVYQVWFNGDANYEFGGLYEIRINNWSEATRFTSVAVTCINGHSSGLRVYAYNDSNGIWITTDSIWGALYIRKFGYDDARRSRGSTLCAVDNNGHLAQADVGGVVGTIPSGYTEVHANDSGGGGYDIENNHRFQAGQGG